MDFSHLQQLDVKADRTSELTLYQIPGEPTLILAPATEANKAYYNALLQSSKGLARRARATGANVAALADIRRIDRELFPKFVVRGWRDVKDAKGKDAPFTVENCAAFLTALPDFLFDDVRKHAGELSNFLDAGQMGEDEVDELAGNSSAG